MSEKIASSALLLIGSLSMTGYIAGAPWLSALGTVTCASPAPKVFSAVRGLETYSIGFAIEWVDQDGGLKTLRITPEVYERLVGPYNRRNVYGAVLAFGPVLSSEEQTRPMFESVLRYAACGDRPLFAELGVDPNTVAGDVRVVIEPLPGTDLGDLPTLLEVPCE